MAESFGAELAEQLRQNVGDALQAVSGADLEWGTLLAQILGQLFVSIIYLGAFSGGYLILISTVRLVLGKHRVETALFIQVRSCLRYLAVLGALLFILAQFGANPRVLKAMARAGFMALGFYMTWLIAGRLIREGMTRYKIDVSIRQLVENLFSVIITALAVVTLLAQFGFDEVSIVAGLGIVGIAVGFAAQSTLSNFIAGITLLIERPFRIGDWVTINGQDGKVIKIALRTTWLRTRDNIFTMIPNDSVASSDIVNYSAEGVTRLNIPVGIAYKESAKAAREVLMPVLLAHPDVLQGTGMQPRVLLRSLGGFFGEPGSTGMDHAR
ncbi:mechanosensitive ion channel family protein [Marinimicrobium locisalis]|uniref:mechanosensitive ion channel family protein n=1 Tax=Marinimicrobium locisalis TaxID=546022 RepID=UPI003221AC0A